MGTTDGPKVWHRDGIIPPGLFADPYAINLSLSPFFREGEISREDITSYFLRGMSVCAKLGFNFQHNFHETSYKKPTFCDTCGGFVSTNPVGLRLPMSGLVLLGLRPSSSVLLQLWGVMKQGFRCKGKTLPGPQITPKVCPLSTENILP